MHLPIKLDRYLLWGVRVGVYLHLLILFVYSKELLFPFGTTKAHLFLLIGELTFILYLWLAARKKEYAPQIGVVGKWLYLFIGVLCLATIFGVDPLASFWSGVERSTGLLFWIHLGMLYMVITGVMQSRRDWNIFLGVIAAASVVVALCFLGEEFKLFVIPATKGGSTIGNSSFFGTYLILSMTLVGVLAARVNSRLQRILALGALFVLIFALLFTSAYAAIYSFFGGGVLFAALALWQSAQSSRGKYAAIGIVSILGLVFLSISVLALTPGSSVRQAVIDMTGEGRFVVWDIALDGIAQRPLLGWGPENVPAVVAEHYNPCFGSSRCDDAWFDRVHNKVLDVLLDAGVLGLIALVGLWFVVAKGLIARLRDGDLTQPILLTGFAAYIVQSLTVFDTLSSFLIWIIALAFVDQLFQNKKILPVSMIVLIVATLLLPITFWFFVIGPFVGNWSSVELLSAPDEQTRLALYEIAATRSGYGIDVRRAFLAQETGRALWKVNAEQASGLSDLFEKEIALTQQANLDTIERAPHALRNYVELAYVYHGASRNFDTYTLEDAELLLKRGLEVSPISHELNWALASVYLGQGRNEEALALTASSLEAGPDVPRAQELHTLAQQIASGEASLALLEKFY
ncbi:MAG: O-antigen ligase family protein [Parcubacteria group bacterium]|nr:O-antigen ligase family protein [Parcubacteria group bacterium]